MFWPQASRPPICVRLPGSSYPRNSELPSINGRTRDGRERGERDEERFESPSLSLLSFFAIGPHTVNRHPPPHARAPRRADLQAPKLKAEISQPTDRRHQECCSCPCPFRFALQVQFPFSFSLSLLPLSLRSHYIPFLAASPKDLWLMNE